MYYMGAGGRYSTPWVVQRMVTMIPGCYSAVASAVVLGMTIMGGTEGTVLEMIPGR